MKTIFIKFQKIDQKTNRVEPDDLMNECLERIKISKCDDQTDSKIRARLDNLRGVDSSKVTKIVFYIFSKIFQLIVNIIYKLFYSMLNKQ
jgi:hypothetical protein